VDLSSPAYFLPGVGSAPAFQIPAMAPIMDAGPWAVADYEHPEFGRGALAYWTGCAAPEHRPGDWRKLADGRHYLPPVTLPSPGQLWRDSGPAGIDLQLSSGIYLTIPLAVYSPQVVDLFTGQITGAATTFGVEAFALFDRMAAEPTIPLTDKQVLRVIALALMARYRLTPELLQDLRWVTTADIDPILSAILGTHPKA
jgi:hypothetical protein